MDFPPAAIADVKPRPFFLAGWGTRLHCVHGGADLRILERDSAIDMS